MVRARTLASISDLGHSWTTTAQYLRVPANVLTYWMCGLDSDRHPTASLHGSLRTYSSTMKVMNASTKPLLLAVDLADPQVC